MSDLVAQLPAFAPAPVVVGREPVTGHSDTDTLRTVGRMARIVCIAAQHPKVVQAAAAAAGGFDRLMSRERVATAIYYWIREHVTFCLDETLVASALIAAGYAVAPDAELLVAPWVLVDMPRPMGDCDDFSMLCASMLSVYGIPARLVIIAADPEVPDQYSHVYTQAQLENGEWITLDCSHGPYPGWEAPRAFRKSTWPILCPAPASTGLHGLNAGDSVLDAQVLRGRPRAGLRRLGSLNAGYSVLDDQVLKGWPRRGVRRLGDLTTLEGDPGPAVSSGSDSSGGGVDWGSLLSSSINNIAAPILKARYAQAPVGTFIQSKDGTYYRGNPNAVGANLPFPPVGSSMSGTTWLVLGGVGLVALLVAFGGHR